LLVGTDPNKLQHLLEVKSGQLQSLLEVTRAISSNFPAQSLYNLYEAIAEGHLSVNILALYIHDKSWDRVVCINSAEICQSVIVPELLDKYKTAGELDDADKEKMPGIRYVIPVYHEDQPLAMALMGSLNEGEDIPPNDSLEFAQTITSIIAVAVENQRLLSKEKKKFAFEKELELASRIQNLLVPGKLPKNNLYEFAGFYLPHKSIGGDYYDVINLNHNEFVFCIADISGKGVAAALVMANLQAYLNAIENYNLEDPSFIRRLNRKVFSVTDGDKFITLFVAKYNILTHELTYVNAGHNPPILMREGREVLLEKGCTIIGAMEEIPFITYGREQLPQGSSILCFTDGLTELENDQGELYSMKRLREFTLQNYHLGADDFIDALTLQLEEFKGKRMFNDDISVLACKIL
jgi:sigma-B regulation protein RsbU (phosphoserine phosphatase)